MNIEQKALKACERYAELSRLIREAKKGIGNNLEKCPGIMGTLLDWQQHKLPNCDDETHLAVYFRTSGEYTAHQAASKALRDCPHCSAAYELVQARKRYRQQLGAAKRFILRIGTGAQLPS